MAIPTTIESLSTTPASNGPSGSDDRNTADDGLRYAYAFIRQTVSLGSNIASASTITPPSTGYAFNITGTTTISTIASTNSWDGRLILLIFAGALTLTHSSNLALPGSANITTAANDIALFVQTGSGAWRLVSYTTSADNRTIQGSLTVNGNTTLGNAGTDTVTTNGNFTVNAPSSGDSLTVAGVSGGLVGRFSLPADGDLVAFIRSGSTNQPQARFTFTEASNLIKLNMTAAAGSPQGAIQVAGNDVISFSTGRAVSIAAPAIGTPLTINGSSSITIDLVNADASGGYIRLRRSSTTDFGFIGNAGSLVSGGTNGSTALRGEDSVVIASGGANARLTVGSAGNVVINAPSSGYGLNIPTGTPASAAAAGTAGDIAWDSSYIYVCTAANTWKRVALSTW